MTSEFITPAIKKIIRCFLHSEYKVIFTFIDYYKLGFPLPDGLHLLKRIRYRMVDGRCVLTMEEEEITKDEVINPWTIYDLFPDMPKHCFSTDPRLKMCDKSAL